MELAKMTHNYLFLFHEQYAVKKLQQQLQQDNFSSKIIDAPRKISSECELAVSIYFSDDEMYKHYINDNVRAIYKINSNHFDLFWKDEF
ncbi:putative Se/S carrier-like protein [Proteus alimentorum]|uniref:putative Se/S carrier-like protein n=1 Tax=Proteus alimentorum TaxID=1973495 RepID=UPI000BFFD461|nr:putative Se/S carrier-like protein [Proteus alimentorum]